MSGTLSFLVTEGCDVAKLEEGQLENSTCTGEVNEVKLVRS